MSGGPNRQATVARVSDPALGQAVHAYFDLDVESPDGQRIVYFSFDGRRPGAGRITIARRDGSEARSVASAPWGLSNEGAKQQWAGNDAVVYRLLGRSATSTRVVPLAGGEPTVIPHALRFYCHATRKGLSQSMRVHGFGEEEEVICLLDLEAGTAEPLIRIAQAVEANPERDAIRVELAERPEPFHFKKPEWTQDGARFFFVFTNAPDGPWPEGTFRVKSLYVCNADGSDLRCLGRFGRAPMWGPNDAYIHTVDPLPGGGNTLVAHPIDGSEPFPLLPRLEGTHGNLSPDGSLVAVDVFNWPEPGRAAIWLYDVADGEHRVLVEFPAPDLSHATGVHPHPSWSRDGRRIYYAAADDQGESALYAIDI